MHDRWVFRLAVAALLVIPRLAYPQGSTVYQNGTVAPNHLAKWFTNGRVGDVGGILGDANGFGVSPFAITDNNGLGLCSYNATTLGPNHSICLGHKSNGDAILSVEGGNFSITVNGADVPLGGGAVAVTGLPTVPTNDALKAQPSTFAPLVVRADFAAGYGAPPQFYQASSSPCGIDGGNGDNGSQVRAADGNCWLAKFDSAGVDPRQFGARLNGQSTSPPAQDDAPFIATAMKNAGVCVVVPNGKTFLWNSTQTFTTGVCLLGGYYSETNYLAPGGSGPGGQFTGGPLMLISNTGITPMVFDGPDARGSRIGGFSVSQIQPAVASVTVGVSPFTYTNATGVDQGIGITGGNVTAVTINGVAQDSFGGGLVPAGQSMVVTYSSQPTMGRWAPTVYGPVFSTTANMLGELRLENINFFGVYAGIKNISGRMRASGIRGQTFLYALYSDANNATDTNYADDFHIWDYWSSDPAVIAWQQGSGDVIRLGRTDGFKGGHLFGLGYKSCLHLAGGSSGPAVGVHIASLDCDAVKYPIWDTDAVSFGHLGYGSEIQIATSQLAAAVSGGNAIQIEGYNSRMKFGSMTIVVTYRSVVNMPQNTVEKGSRVWFGALDVSGTFNYASGAPCNGTWPMFNVAHKTGPPHQIYMATPTDPTGCGFTNGGTSSGIINVDTQPGSAVLYTPWENWVTQNVATGGTYQMPNWAQLVIASSGAAVSGITYKLPDQAVSGQEVALYATQAQTGITIDAGLAFLVNPPLTALSAYTPVKFKYLKPNTTWYRTQ